MEIREALERDIPGLNRIIRGSFRDVAERFALTEENCPTHPSFCTADWLEAAFGKGVRFFVLEDDGKDCGCAALERARPEVCYLERLAMLPAYRHRGHGERLVRHVLEEARATKVERVQIGIIAAQTELRDWYLALGFEETGRKRFEHLPFEVAFMALRL
jgi:GNAT superfamily N-acetyltransferase